MSQHTYTLKFTIVAPPTQTGKYLYGSEEHDLKTEQLTEEKEAIIKSEVEAKIKNAIPTERGAVQVVFDELTESE